MTLSRSVFGWVGRPLFSYWDGQWSAQPPYVLRRRLTFYAPEKPGFYTPEQHGFSAYKLHSLSTHTLHRFSAHELHCLYAPELHDLSNPISHSFSKHKLHSLPVPESHGFYAPKLHSFSALQLPLVGQRLLKFNPQDSLVPHLPSLLQSSLSSLKSISQSPLLRFPWLHLRFLPRGYGSLWHWPKLKPGWS